MNDRHIVKTKTGVWITEFIGMDGNFAVYEEEYIPGIPGKTCKIQPRPAQTSITGTVEGV